MVCGYTAQAIYQGLCLSHNGRRQGTYESMPCRPRPLVGRNDVYIIGECKHRHVVGEGTAPLGFLGEVFGGIAVEQDGFEFSFEGVHVWRDV